MSARNGRGARSARPGRGIRSPRPMTTSSKPRSSPTTPVTSTLPGTPNRNRERKTLDAEDPQVNGQDHLSDGPPGNGVADDEFGESGRPTIPLDRWKPDADGLRGAYPPAGGRLPNGNGHDVLSARPDLSTEATEVEASEDHAFPQAAAPSHGPGRWLRSLIGVDERLLDRVWEERARYTGLGAIVLGTATMATLAMLDALDQVFGPIWPVLILVALFWGAFICGIDRWLIASTHGARSGQWHVFVPRIFLALLFGVDHRDSARAYCVRLGGRVTG